MIVDGERFAPDDSDRQFVRALGWMRVLEKLDPRLEHPSEDRPADIGAYLGVEEAARLAHKLRDDFRLSEAAIAEWLTTYDYTSTRGDSYSAGAVHAMLKRRDSDVDVERSQMPAGARTRLMPKLWAVSFGPAAEAMLPDLEAWNAQQREPVAAVGPIPGPDRSHVTVLDRPALLTLLRTAPLVSSVHLSAESDLADDEIQRMFLLALLDEHGAKVFIDGNEVRGWEERDEASRRTYLGARSAVRLHAILRAHDQGTVEDPSLTQDAAYNLARTIRDRAYQHSLKQAAMKLNEEAIPTKGRHGHWWADSVQALLGGRGR